VGDIWHGNEDSAAWGQERPEALKILKWLREVLQYIEK
jgi:hypothetical protein